MLCIVTNDTNSFTIYLIFKYDCETESLMILSNIDEHMIVFTSVSSVNYEHL